MTAPSAWPRDEPAILRKVEGGIARITLNRSVGNAIDLPLARALLDAAIACEFDLLCGVTGAGNVLRRR